MIKLTAALTSLICLAGLAPANALERVPVPDPVRACPRYGPGFVEVPGTSTCMRVGGRVRSEYTTGTRQVSRDQIAGFGTSGRVSVDTRTDTAYGPLRSYVRVGVGSRTGGDR